MAVLEMGLRVRVELLSWRLPAGSEVAPRRVGLTIHAVLSEGRR